MEQAWHGSDRGRRLGTDPIRADPPREVGFGRHPRHVGGGTRTSHRAHDPQAIERAKISRRRHFPTDDYYSSIIDWQSTQRGHRIDREAHRLRERVLKGAISTLTAFVASATACCRTAQPTSGVHPSTKNNGYRIVHSLVHTLTSGVWRMDYEDMDKKLKEHHIHVVFCSPHNLADAWERWEIEKAMEVAKANDYAVISTIWSDLTWESPAHPHPVGQRDARPEPRRSTRPARPSTSPASWAATIILYNPRAGTGSIGWRLEVLL